MADLSMARQSALAGLPMPSKAGSATVADAGFAARFVYRGAPETIRAASAATLPTAPLRARIEGARAALWLGPDEWLLLVPEVDGAALQAALADAARGLPASIVDVSHRQIGLVVSGPRAGVLLNAGCPLDLDPAAFPVGMCTRTLLAKAEIVLWRTGEDAFRLEVARSFAPYAVGFLREAMHGIG